MCVCVYIYVCMYVCIYKRSCVGTDNLKIRYYNVLVACCVFCVKGVGITAE